MTNARRTAPNEKFRLRLTDRDIRLLLDLSLQRIISRDQLIALGYFDSIPRCNSRLHQLVEAGFIRRFLPIGSQTGGQSLYCATQAAVKFLAARFRFDAATRALSQQQTASPFILLHTLRLVDLRIAFEQNAATTGAMIERWLPEVLCRHEYSVRGSSLEPWQQHILKPDAFVRIVRPPQRFSYFVELDLGHVSSSQFARKTDSYWEYLDLKLFQELYPDPLFRVLVVTTGLKRLQHLAALTDHCLPEFLFATYQDIEAVGPFQALWQTAKTRCSLFGGTQ